MKRANIAVTTHVELDDVVSPKTIRWHDGRKWSVDRVLHTCRSPDGEFAGTRYTVLIGGMEKYLYRDCATWYVLVPDKELQNK